MGFPRYPDQPTGHPAYPGTMTTRNTSPAHHGSTAGALADLRAVLQHLADELPTRAHDLRWIAAEYTAADRDNLLPPARTLEDLLHPAAVTTYLMAAEHGLLRTVPTARTVRGVIHPTSPATDYKRRLLMREIAAVAAQDFPELPGTPFRAPQPDITRAQIAQLRAMLERHSALTDLERGYDDWQRHLAMTAVVLDAHTARGDLQRMRLQDLHDGLTLLDVHRKPPGRYSTSSTTHHELRHTTTVLLTNWLTIRRRLTAAVQGGRDAVWVTLLPGSNGTARSDPQHYVRPPGIALQSTGLHRAWRRNTLAANVLMHGSPGWEPLPYRCGNLTRAARPQAT